MEGSDTSSHAASRRWRLWEHFRQQWAGLLALALVLGGGTAYAVDGPLAGQNTVGSEDVINGEVKTADIGGGEVKTADIGNDAVAGSKVLDDSLGNVDLKAGSVRASEVANGSLSGTEIGNGTVTSDDVNESTLPLPGLMIPVDASGYQNLTLGPEDEFVFLHEPVPVFSLLQTTKFTAVISTTMRTDTVGGNVDYAFCVKQFSTEISPEVMFPSRGPEGSFFPDRFSDLTMSIHSAQFPPQNGYVAGLCARKASTGTLTVHVSDVTGWILATETD